MPALHFMTEDFRKTPPGSLDPIPFSIAAPFRTTLPNGLKIIVFEDKRFPLISYRLAFNFGDANDPDDAGGLTSALTSMLSEGTESYSSRQLAEEIERLGASIGASSSDDFTIVSASALSLYNADILRLMSEIIFRPTFPEDEFSLYRRNTVENLKFQRSQPNFLANEQTARLLYGQHPYAKVSPSAEDVEKLERQRLADFHREKLIPNNATFIIVGDVDTSELVKEIEARFGDWQPGAVAAADFARPPERSARTLTIVDRPGSAQSNIVLANLAIERNHPDYFSLLVMNQVLGAGASSRIFMNLREEKGYTYGAYSRLDTKKRAGDFEATAEVRTTVTGESLKEFFYELNRIRDDAALDQELTDAKNFLTGVFPIRAETQEGLINLIVSQQLYGLPEDYLQTYREKISAVTPEDVQRVAKQYIHPESLAMVIVGDAEEILAQAREYAAEVEIFDTDGKPRDVSDYGKAETAETADVSGKWSLTVDFQGQQLPVSLVLTQDGDTVSGKLKTMLGDGEIADGKVRGSKLSAVARAEMQGQEVEFAITGTIDGDSMTGTLSAPIVPDALPFTGERKR
jgi:zinc protease